MQAFLNRLRTQPSQKAEQQPSIPFSEASSSSTNQAWTEPIVTAPPNPFEGIRKIHPNQDELLSSTQEVPNQASSPRRGSANELGMRVPPALARVANRKVTPTGVDETIREGSESQRPEELDQLAPEPSPSRKSQNLSLFSAVPFSGAAGWSTFGRNKKDKQTPLPLTEDRLANTRGATVSRTSSQSRTATTATRTPPTKTSGLSRSSSAKLSRNNSTKQPASSPIEQASYSRVPLVPTHDIHENNNSLRIAEGEASPSRSHHQHHSQQETTPSSPSTRPLSLFNTAHPHEHIDGTYPPRTAVTKQDESVAASSLPFTFGRQPPARQLAENIFISEFGTASPPEDRNLHHSSDRRASAILASQSAVPGGTQWPSMVTEETLRLSLAPHGTYITSQPSEPFPLVGTPTSEVLPPSSTHARPRAHLASDTSTDPYGGSTSDDARNAVPSLLSDRSNAEPSSSQGSGFTMDLPLRNMASFGSSGDELTNPRVGPSWNNPSDGGGGSRFEAGPRVRQISEESRRKRTGSSSSAGIRGLLRRPSSEKPMGVLNEKPQNLPAFGLLDPITVFPATVTNSQEFPKQNGSHPAAAATPTTSTSETPDQPPRTSNLAVTPAVEVTAPTPRPSPARSRSRSNRLTDLFMRENLRIPDGHAHPSGLGVVGVEPHSRRQSLKVMGKRKAGDSEEENEIVVNDERGHRPRFDSSAPSSYHRKRMKLSNASEKDIAALRASRAASRSGATSTQSFDSSRPATAARRSMSRNASAVSIPVSAIVSPRAPSIHRSISGASRRSDGFRYQDPLRNRSNRNQRRRKTEAWADSWILDRDEMPVQAWLFLVGFVFPLCWWAACVLPIKRGGPAKDKGKGKGSEAGHDAPDRSGSGLWVDQAQYDEELSRLWRTRCFIAAVLSTLVYVPVIACAVVFSKR